MNTRKLDYKYDPFFIGFDELFNKLNVQPTQTQYPPYNILKRGENRYLLEMAVAGFSEHDLDVSLKENTLVIKGKTISSEMPYDYIHKGIASRDFERKFTLAENIEIKDVMLLNGMLSIKLESFVPEEKREKKFKINSNDKEFLTE